MSFFISDAMATATHPGAQGEGPFSLIMIAAIFILFYFMLIRPQNIKAKEQRELLTALKKGDEVITSSGILAKIVSLDEQYIRISPAEGLEIFVQKGSISTLLPKGTLKSL